MFFEQPPSIGEPEAQRQETVRQRGFAPVILVTIVAMLIIAGGTYFAIKQRGQVAPTLKITTPLLQIDNQATKVSNTIDKITIPRKALQNSPITDKPFLPVTNTSDIWSGASKFGDVSYKNGEFILKEGDIADAGFYLDVDFDETALSLLFDYKFLFAGDGDFFFVSGVSNPATGAGETLYQGIDIELTRQKFLTGEAELWHFAGKKKQRLIFTLKSRGQKNATVSIKNLRFDPQDSVKPIK